MSISKVTRNFQITIPRDVRDAQNVHIGDKMIFIVKENGVDLVKLDDKALADAAGIWPDFKGSSVDYVRKMRKEWVGRPKSPFHLRQVPSADQIAVIRPSQRA